MTAELQPATCFYDHTFDPPFRYTNTPRSVKRCRKCGQNRLASSLVAQCTPTGVRYFCTPECPKKPRRKKK